MNYALKHLFIYATWACNMRCRHCWVLAGNEMYDHSRDLSAGTLLSIIEEAADLGLQFIKVSGGEPLLKEKTLLAIAEKAEEKQLKLSIETNGTLITREFLDQLPETDITFILSLDGASAGDHDAMRGVKGAYTKVIRAFQLLKEHKRPYYVVHAIHRENVHKVPEMIQFCQEMEIPALKLNPIMRVGKALEFDEKSEGAFVFNAGEIIDMNNRYCSRKHGGVDVRMMIPVAFNAVPALLAKSKNQRIYATCPTLNMISVFPNGDFSLCGEGRYNKDFIFGNALENNLKDVWEKSENLTTLRRMIPGELEGVCSVCMVRNLCLGSCRVAALLEGGKINSPNPVCQELYEQGKFHLVKKSKAG
jgi:SynChlorMet cassette radical SAM/SPASM protein ScmF